MSQATIYTYLVSFAPGGETFVIKTDEAGQLIEFDHRALPQDLQYTVNFSDFFSYTLIGHSAAE